MVRKREPRGGLQLRCCARLGFNADTSPDLVHDVIDPLSCWAAGLLVRRGVLVIGMAARRTHTHTVPIEFLLVHKCIHHVGVVDDDVVRRVQGLCIEVASQNGQVAIAARMLHVLAQLERLADAVGQVHVTVAVVLCVEMRDVEVDV